jgi:hypothetical protein
MLQDNTDKQTTLELQDILWKAESTTMDIEDEFLVSFHSLLGLSNGVLPISLIVSNSLLDLRLLPLFPVGPYVEEWINGFRQQCHDHAANAPPAGNIRPVLRHVPISPNEHQECSDTPQISRHPASPS